MNAQLLCWFDQGKIKESLLGDGIFFIPSHTYRDSHDSLLVMYALFEWANSENKKFMVNDEFFEAIDTALKKEIKEGFRLILTYYIVRDSKKITILDDSRLASKIDSMIIKYAKEIVADERLRAVVLSVEKYARLS